MVKWLVLSSLDQEAPSLNPAGGRSQLDCMVLCCTEPFIIILPLSLYDLNNIERDLKYQTIRISV